MFCSMVLKAELFTKEKNDRLDRTYTRILRVIIGVSWKGHQTKELFEI